MSVTSTVECDWVQAVMNSPDAYEVIDPAHFGVWFIRCGTFQDACAHLLCDALQVLSAVSSLPIA